MKDEQHSNKNRKSTMHVLMKQNKSVNNTLTRQHGTLRNINVYIIK